MIPFNQMVVSRAHRILHSLESFNPSSDAHPSFVVPGGETFVGYFEDSETGQRQLLITDLALYGVAPNRTVRVPYEKIIDVTLKEPEVANSSPSALKSDADTLTITMTTGQKVDFPVTGKRGRFRDIFEVLRFIDRVVSDYERHLPWWRRRWQRFRVGRSR